jgi:hypothetical protein
MTEYDNSQDASQTQGSRGANLGVDLIDVVIRNLETARANIEGGAGPAAAGATFCGVLYAQAGGPLCPLLYYHSLTDEGETAPAKTAPGE